MAIFITTKNTVVRDIEPEHFPEFAKLCYEALGQTTAEARGKFQSMLKKQRQIVRPYTPDCDQVESFTVWNQHTDEFMGFRRNRVRGENGRIIVDGTQHGVSLYLPKFQGQGVYNEVEHGMWRAWFDRLGVDESRHALVASAHSTIVGKQGFLVPTGRVDEGQSGEIVHVRGTREDWLAYRATLPPDPAFTYQGNAFSPRAPAVPKPLTGNLAVIQPVHDDVRGGWLIHPDLFITDAELDEAIPGAGTWMHQHKFAAVCTKADVLNHLKDWHDRLNEAQLTNVTQRMIFESGLPFT